MAMNFGRKLIHQISSRRFASSTGGNLGSSTGLAGGSQIVRSYQRINKLMDGHLPWTCFFIFMTGVWSCAYKIKDGWVRDMIKEPDEALRKMMDKKGVNREFCEAKIADIKQKIGSGSTLEHERIILQVYERWMREFTRDT